MGGAEKPNWVTNNSRFNLPELEFSQGREDFFCVVKSINIRESSIRVVLIKTITNDSSQSCGPQSCELWL